MEKKQLTVEIPDILFFLGLKPIEFRLYAFLKMFHEHIKGMPTHEIAALCEISRNTFTATVKRLQAGKNRYGVPLIEVVPTKTRGGGYSTNEYVILDLNITLDE